MVAKFTSDHPQGIDRAIEFGQWCANVVNEISERGLDAAKEYGNLRDGSINNALSIMDAVRQHEAEFGTAEFHVMDGMLIAPRTRLIPHWNHGQGKQFTLTADVRYEIIFNATTAHQQVQLAASKP